MTTCTKTCISCHEKKRTDAFNRDCYKPDGRRNVCKACCQVAERQYRKPRNDSEAAQAVRRTAERKDWDQLAKDFNWSGRPWNRRSYMGVFERRVQG